MLFKRDTATALHAQLALTADRSSGPESGVPADPALSDELRQSAPSAEQLEIAKLREANAALERELRDQRQSWQVALEEAEARALAIAARQHVIDDEERLAALHNVLEAARGAFDASLVTGCAKLAKALAAQALSRLVAPQAGEEEWLARSVAHRLEQLGDEAVVALQLPSDFDETLLNQLRGRLGPGTAVTRDPEIGPGTARIVLRLGRVVIDPGAGLRDLLSLIEEGRHAA